MNDDLKLHWQEDSAVCGWFISYLYRKSSTQMAAVSRDLDLSLAQSIVLVGIYRREGVNQRTLADAIAMAPGVISRVLRDLEDRGCITKQRDEQNRRNYNLYLTPTGEALAEKSLLIQHDYWNKLLECFTHEEVGILNTLLNKMTQHANTISEEFSSAALRDIDCTDAETK